MISTHKSKAGTVSFYVRVGNGKSKAFSERDYRTRTDARNAARQYELDLKTGKQFAAIPTAAEYADRLLDHWAKEGLRDGRKRKDSTLDTLRSNLVRFREQFGSRPLDRIDRGAARDWSLSAPANSVKTACQLFNRAIEEGLVAANPFRGLTPTSSGRSDQAPPTPEEFEALLQAWSKHGKYAPMGRALQRFAGHSGMRPGELFALRWDDVDFEANRINVARRLYAGTTDLPKSNKPRRIVLTLEARRAIEGLDRVSEYVFVSKRGQRLSQTTLWNYWQVVCAKAGLDFDFYTASKHFCCHRWHVIEGKSDNAIAQQMGWSRKAVQDLLRIYGHGNIGWEAEFEEKVSDIAEARRKKASGE